MGVLRLGIVNKTVKLDKVGYDFGTFIDKDRELIGYKPLCKPREIGVDLMDGNIFFDTGTRSFFSAKEADGRFIPLGATVYSELDIFNVPFFESGSDNQTREIYTSIVFDLENRRGNNLICLFDTKKEIEGDNFMDCVSFVPVVFLHSKHGMNENHYSFLYDVNALFLGEYIDSIPLFEKDIAVARAYEEREGVTAKNALNRAKLLIDLMQRFDNNTKSKMQQQIFKNIQINTAKMLDQFVYGVVRDERQASACDLASLTTKVIKCEKDIQKASQKEESKIK